MKQPESLRATFIDEAGELLEQMQAALVDFEQVEDRAETVRALFRAAHTLKGSAGLFGLHNVVRFAHVVESLLEELRSQPQRLDAEMVKVLLEAHDELERLIESDADGSRPEASGALVERVNALLSSAPAAHGATPPPAEAAAAQGTRRWHLTARFGESTFRDGFDPVSFLRFLEKRGHVERLETTLVAADGPFDPESCRLAFSLDFVSPLPREELLSVFDFVREQSVIELVEHQPERQAVALAGPGSRSAAPMVKVPAGRLDTLVDRVSELVIASAAAELRASQNGDRATLEAFAAVRALVAGIRDAALGLRMVQIGETFGRFRRVVRELSGALKKEVSVEVRGAETELDKAMVERLADPLLHIVRNALDHGLETPEVRVSKGKPRAGHLLLEAQHQAGQIVIDVRDDGGGLDREKIRRKARERGLVPPGATLTDAQVDDLIFAPGFSSADQVTDVSGRGVGMDVVRRTIDALRGTVEVLSEPGRGTTIRLRLPLTLAIIDGFLLGVAGSSFVVPSKLVRECLDFPRGGGDNHWLHLRDEPVPWVRLRDFFELEAAAPRRESVVIIEYGDRKVGLVVDRLLGVSQTVIKPLGPLFEQLHGIGGSTILGSGEVALILDVPQLVRSVEAVPAHSASASPVLH